MDSYQRTDAEQNTIFEMMIKQHLTDGLVRNDGETSFHLEDQSLPTPVVYKKRERVKFTSEQLDVLEATFEEHRYPTIDMIDDLVEQLQLPTQKITVWFQNRRARLKKSQQRVDDHPSFDRDDHSGHYDSGIHLDVETSRDSTSSSPSGHCFPPVPNIGYMPSPYYLPPTSQTFYNPMWPNFPYSLPPASTSNVPYQFGHYNSSFVSPEFYG